MLILTDPCGERVISEIASRAGDSRKWSSAEIINGKILYIAFREARILKRPQGPQFGQRIDGRAHLPLPMGLGGPL